ncbi:DUF1285 domain-containing protein [Kiloniella laminariae]|uniref:DUF1285 domain-containing protein n=1 Tax=Kiloniella laminariae TaxID=454162 RepID=A0ABT4LL50_9PROT|nr:DUF1285 domain-containing protein [Kiloniella laminariae]MCZ4281844.1 DUF1285 domain-containing protein [Kiloniella laminariae]
MVKDKQNVTEEAAIKAAAAALPLTSDVDMRIARDGQWYHEGRMIERKPLVRLFSTVLRQDNEGVYWLVTPVERARILVEDAPFVAVEIRHSGEGQSRVISFRNNVDTWFDLDADHPIRFETSSATSEELQNHSEKQVPVPYVLVREGLEARLLRSVYYQLVDLAEVREEKIGVWSKGKFHVFGNVEQIDE